jgi:hypothetical protein
VSTIEILAEIEGIVATALREARDSMSGLCPEPDPQIVALRILHALAQALRTDAGFRDEVRRALVPIEA